jgi:hypothetical protein
MKRFSAPVLVVSAAVALAGPVASQEPASPPATRFAGTWVGTQAWDIQNPPPGSRQDQPVTLTIEIVDGRVTGTMKPFLGADEGATFVDARMVGDQLQASAVVGRPRAGARAAAPPRGNAGGGAAAPRRGGAPGGWKDAVDIAFVFRNDGVELTGTADVKLGEVPWMKFKYALSKKRSRY